MVLLNKALVTTFHYTHFMGLIMIQNMVGLCCLLLLRKYFDFVNFSIKLELRLVKIWFPANLFFLFMLYSGSGSLHGLPVQLVTVFKNTTNVIIAIGDFIFFNNKTSSMGVFSFMLTMLATIYSAKEDFEHHNRMQGYIFMTMNCLTTAGYVLYLRYAIEKTKFTRFQAAYYNNVLSIPVLFILVWLNNGNPMTPFMDDSFSNLSFCLMLLGTGSLGVVLSISAMWCIESTSPTTYCVVGAGNKVILAVLGVIFFKSNVTQKTWVFIFVGILAGLLYGLSKLPSNNDIASKSLNKTSSIQLREKQNSNRKNDKSMV
jgi:GDP-mannose transporter